MTHLRAHEPSLILLSSLSTARMEIPNIELTPKWHVVAKMHHAAAVAVHSRLPARQAASADRLRTPCCRTRRVALARRRKRNAAVAGRNAPNATRDVLVCCR